MKKLLCFIFGHKYKLKRRITRDISELVCARCKEEFGLNKTVKTVLPLDDELKEIHQLYLTEKQ